MRFAEAGIGAVQRELERLAAARLVTIRKQGNQKYYQADRQSPIFEELSSLIRKIEAGELAVRDVEGTCRTDDRVRTNDRRRLEIPYPKLWELCRRYHVRKLSLFGSAARGELRPGSDVDLMVEFESGCAPSLWETDMENEFSALFGGRRVDLVPLGIMRNPYRRKTIEPDLRVLYEAK